MSEKQTSSEVHDIKAITGGLSTDQIEGWIDATDKVLATTTDPTEVDTISHSRDDLRKLRQQALDADENFHAAMTGIPLRALRGKTQPGDPDHIPSISITKEKHDDASLAS